MFKFALAGNPNSGKTTLFNALTGSTARVGNWPGVTVDKREGAYKRENFSAAIVDLPGIYSLSPYTPEEVVARNFLLEGKPDCIVNVVDSTNLERNLYLTTQLMELELPLVVALNMTDVLEKRGDRLNVSLLERRLGVPVVEISALKGKNINLLMQKASLEAKKKREAYTLLKGSSLWEVIEKAERFLRVQRVHAPLFHAIKLVEGDEVEQKAYPDLAATLSLKNIDGEAEIADARYRYITERLSLALTRAEKPKNGALTSSDKADKLLTHKHWGLLIFLLILFFVFHSTFSKNFLYLGTIFPSFGRWCAHRNGGIKGIFFSEGIHSFGVVLFNAMEKLTRLIGKGLGQGLGRWGVGGAVKGLILDGIWGGIAAVLSFLPQVLLLFLFFSLLEDSGYMARAAFMLDRLFRRFGVSGRAFLPMVMGFGCSVPAILNTRTLASERERTATVRVIPFFPCGAKMPVLLALSGATVQAFGVGNTDAITCGLYLLCIATAFVSLLVMQSLQPHGESTPFLMELPSYRLPALKNLALLLWDKAKHFLQKAFTVILLSCVAVWILSHFGWEWRYVGERLDESILASLGKFIQPLFTPLGFGSQLGKNGWVFAVAALMGLVAKEDVIAAFGTLGACVLPNFLGASQNGVYEMVAMVEATGIGAPALLSFAMFNMLTLPCIAALAAARGELGRTEFHRALLFWAFVSYLLSAIVYTVGEWRWTAFLWVLLALSVGVGIAFYRRFSRGRYALNIKNRGVKTP